MMRPEDSMRLPADVIRRRTKIDNFVDFIRPQARSMIRANHSCT